MATANYTIKAVTTLALGLQLGQSAMAHNGELHSPKKKAISEEMQPNTAGPDPIDSSADVSESNAASPTVTSVAEADVSQPVSATISLDSFSIGLGEILLGLVLIFPWLLITLRKQLHLSTHS